ncbi:nucleotidyltransferase family protein [uncultured Ruminococcus sp.]|uniref:nucleotidyltransferase domain-containing protein n=1 Tax=uncultured Ruminococcus sp. TaxID=165186 RepID=UPI0025D354C9|nr:nucleotidyltransferase family protein [uncultured Ruminococcus sp.]
MERESTTTQIALLEALKASLFGTEPVYPEDTDWAEVVNEAKVQTVMGVISPVVPVTDEITNIGITNYSMLLYEQDKLVRLLDKNGIPVVILKGFAAAKYYPKPHLRSMGDIDILVPRDRFYDAVSLLEANGFEYSHGKGDDGKLGVDSRHIGYMKDGIEYELHHHFSSKGFDIDDILEKAIDKREYVTMNGYKVPMLPDIENGLVLLGHLNQHLVAGNLGFRQLVDWAVFVHKVLNEQQQTERFMSLVEKSGLKKLAANVTFMCTKELGLSDDCGIAQGADPEVSDILLSMIFESGNFGAKNGGTPHDNNELLVSDGMYNIKKNGFFPYFQDMGLKRWSLCSKYKFLRPFAWIYGIFRAVRLGIISEVKTGSFRKQIHEGSEKYVLYEKLGIEASSTTVKNDH